MLFFVAQRSIADRFPRVVLETDSNGMNDSDTSSDLDRGDSDDGSSSNGQCDAPMQNWKEFDEDAAYQKKRVDPEMRRWVLTKDCRRTVSDDYFKNPARNRGKCDLLYEQ